MIHALIAVTIQLIIGLLTGEFLLPGVALSFLYIGREVTQAEYRAIAAFYDGKRANAPWWCGFEPRAWNLKSMLDWALPCTATSLLTVLAVIWHILRTIR